MKARVLLLLGVCCSLLLLAACFDGEQSSVEMDPPENAEAVNEDEENVQDTVQEDYTSEIESNTVARQLYLIDANGMVASQVIELPLLESKEVATQVLEYLVVDGPVTEIIPNGFRAVLPAGTEILGLNLQEDGTMIVDLSEEFTEYQATDELKIIESVTHTLTQFDNVERVKLWINGMPLAEMPVNGTPLGSGYSKANGINITSSDVTDFLNSEAVTMYYPAAYQENRYYVPVTQYVEVMEGDEFQAVIDSLISGPGINTNVLHVFNAGVSLVEEPILNEGILQLTFNEEVLQDVESSVIADEVVETIVRTLTAQEQIEAVEIKVQNKEVLNNENGESYSEPVTAEFFSPAEQL